METINEIRPIADKIANEAFGAFGNDPAVNEGDVRSLFDSLGVKFTRMSSEWYSRKEFSPKHRYVEVDGIAYYEANMPQKPFFADQISEFSFVPHNTLIVEDVVPEGADPSYSRKVLLARFNDDYLYTEPEEAYQRMLGYKAELPNVFRREFELIGSIDESELARTFHGNVRQMPRNTARNFVHQPSDDSDCTNGDDMGRCA